MSYDEIPAIDQSFAEHVQRGLSSKIKYLSSKYFYDDAGSRLFQDIMNLPEYYLTDAEHEILNDQSFDLIATLEIDRKINVIELGAGDGFKTKLLLEAMVKQGIPLDFIPIDISKQAISDLEENMHQAIPELSIKSIIGDYFQVLPSILTRNNLNLILFLGSNIGNFEVEAAYEMLAHLGRDMQTKDYCLIGFDLKKNPAIIKAAYDDPQGVTHAFNLNLLHRINRELGGNFQLDNFDFYSYYDPVRGEVRSFIVSLRDQVVKIDALQQNFSFTTAEVIRTELSKKYDLDEISDMAFSTGFVPVRHFLDQRAYFADSLWRKA